MFRLVILWLLLSVSIAGAHPNHQLELLAAKPGSDWEQDAYPIGNGWFGALVLAGIEQDQLRLSDKALRSSPEGELLALGNLQIHTGHDPKEARALLRRLDLQSGLAEITYRHGNTRYRREYFCSHPDRILGARFRAQGQDRLDLYISLETELLEKEIRYDPSKKQLILTSQPSTGQPSTEIRIQLLLKDGTAEWDGQRLKIRDSNEVSLLLSTSVNNAFSPEEALAALSDADLSEIFQRHLEDYHQLFHAMYLTIEGPSQTNWPTEQRLEAYRKDPRLDPGLEELYFQYARYLLIASSRADTAPMHRRGIWHYPPTKNVGNSAPPADPLPMVYWLAKATQLQPCLPGTLAFDTLFPVFDERKADPLPTAPNPTDLSDQQALLMNKWARQGEGDTAHRFLQSQIKERTLLNLMSTDHDVASNLGCANVVIEMLLQSNDDALEFLPALPSQWPDGSLQGLHTSGGFEVAFAWQNGEFLEAYITALQDADCRIHFDIPLLAELASGDGIAQRIEGNFLVVPLKAEEMIRVVRKEEASED